MMSCIFLPVGRVMTPRYVVAAALLAISVAAGAAPVGDALVRPALISPQASQAVLLGAAQAGDRLVAVGERGIVVLSDDGGTSWRQVPVPVSVTLTAVRFSDAAKGFAVGHGGTVLVTADGGETWAPSLDGRRAAELALAGAQASHDERAKREAERLVADGPDKPLFDVLVLDAEHAIVVGAYGLAFATGDGGQTWVSWMDRFENPRGLHFYAIRRHGERILVVGEQGLVRLSNDGGRRFVALESPYEGSYFTAELPHADELVVAGLRGNVWRSLDSGASWTQVEVPVPASITASALKSDGSLVLVNQAGLVLGERGSALLPMNPAPLPPLSGILLKRDGSLLALGTHGAMSVPIGDQK